MRARERENEEKEAKRERERDRGKARLSEREGERERERNKREREREIKERFWIVGKRIQDPTFFVAKPHRNLIIMLVPVLTVTAKKRMSVIRQTCYMMVKLLCSKSSQVKSIQSMEKNFMIYGISHFIV